MSKHLLKISSARIILLVTLLIVLYFLVSGALDFVRSQQLRQEEHRLRGDIVQLQRRYQRLEALREYLSSDEYIEAVARAQLGLVREGEIGFVALSTMPSASLVPGEEGPALWWDVLIR